MSRDIYVMIEHLRNQVAEISYVSLAAARELANATGGSVVGVLLGHDARELAQDLAADYVIYLDHPALADFTSDAYQRVLAEVITDSTPRAMLFGDTSIGGDLAPWLSANLSIPLVSSCRSFRAEGSQLKFVGQICGGKIVVEGQVPEPSALVMMVPGGVKADGGRSAQPPEIRKRSPQASLDDLRVSVVNYIEPATGDVDISRERILVAVGRGVQNQDNLELAKDLARALGGEVCSSRPVVDQGWLPPTRLVGKSGKRVKPVLYLALGISGAPEHVESITDSETIVAVNTDPTAPIFNVAQYGTETDLLDLLPALIERVKQAKGA